MNPIWTLLIIWISASGLVGFALMGIDKARARDREWRVPEASLFTLALLGGAFGILIGSSVFHHKTLKVPFMGAVILFALLWVGVLFALGRVIGSPFG